jgi:penicillin-insensitive murein endopeptidase
VALPTNATNRYGYGIEFDKDGRYRDYTIDFDALAEHLYWLHDGAKSRGVGIALVIFDRSFLPKLFATVRGPFLQQHVQFMQGAAWVRHDEHYHVDFAVPCRPMN